MEPIPPKPEIVTGISNTVKAVALLLLFSGTLIWLGYRKITGEDVEDEFGMRVFRWVVAAIAVTSWFRAGTFVATGDMGPFIRRGWAPEAWWSWNHAITGAGSAAYVMARWYELFLIDALAFVGSTRVAKLVYGRAAATGKRVLCLGGAKNHLIVVPDADPDVTIENVVASFTGRAGQRRMAAGIMKVMEAE